MGLFNFGGIGKKKDERTPVERYMEHLDAIFQQEPVFFGGGKNEDGKPNVTVMVYENIPEEGFITGITYGLSLYKHTDWKLCRPELCISVKSTNGSWAQVARYLADTLGGDCPFSYGQAINFREQISEDSAMDAFFIFAPSTLDIKDYENIDIGTDYRINIVGLYPMYSSELETFENIGLEQFWHHPNFDNYAVNRKKIHEV